MTVDVAPVRKRLDRIDIARGIALIAMAIYHTGWDFEFFGYLDAGTTAHGGWKLFARCIASSFLVLVGFSLVLAHGRQVRWPNFFRRLLQIVAAAVLISVATWFFTPDTFVFFGILHHIALASLLGVALIRLPFPALIALAIAVIAAPNFLRSEVFDHPALWWVGLSTIPLRTNDYVPMFPWFGAVLLGMAGARIFQRFELMPMLDGGIRPQWLQNGLTFIGRHSLAFYLIHQPVLIGLVFLLSQLFPPNILTPHEVFGQSCEQSCSETRDQAFCKRFCDCVIGDFEAKTIFDDVYSGKRDTTTDPSVLDTIEQCTDGSELPN